MKEYIRPNEAFMMLDKNKIREWGKHFERNMPLAEVRRIFDAMIQEGRIFYVVSGSGILLEKDSFLEAFPDLLKEEYRSPETAQGFDGRYFPEPHICTLQVEDFEDTYDFPGNILIDDIFCDYHLETLSLKASLEREGVFPLLNCTCGEIYCGGLFVEVKHLDDDRAAWVMFYDQEKYPVKSLGGHFVQEDDYREYVNISSTLNEIEPVHKREAQSRARGIIRSSKRVFIPLPLFFSRSQLKEIAG